MGSSDEQPMTSERLAEIMSLTADVVAGRIHVRFDEETAWLAILDLRREVERLRAREAALVAVVLHVAEEDNSDSSICYQLCPMRFVSDSPGSDNYADMEHTGPCVVEQARALLASAEAGEPQEAFDCPGCGGRWREDELGPMPGILRCPNCGEFCEPATSKPGEA